MFQNKKMLLFSAILLASTIAEAAPSNFPKGCEVKGFSFNSNHLVLNDEGNQTIYLIQNHSDKLIELERYETRDVFMSPKLQSKLGPQNWAAFASDVASLHFQCYSHNGDETALINCNDVLEVCQYPRAKFALSNMGNYWISTNKPQTQVIKDAAAKGIYLRW